MAAVFAVFAAMAWGSSDFLAGRSARRSSAISVVVLTHLVAAAVLFGFALEGLGVAGVGSRRVPGMADLGWGLGAGLGGGVGAMLLFRGLATGSMAIVASVSAAGAATIPTVVGVLTGDELSTVGRVGVVLAIVAIALLSFGGDDSSLDESADRSNGSRGPEPTGEPGLLLRTRERTRMRTLHDAGIVYALGSGAGFGLFFVCLSRASESSGYWPLLTARGASVVLFALVAWRIAVPTLPEPGSRLPVAGAGVLDAAAAILYLTALRSGLLSVVSVLASLYPAMTAFLAWRIARERIVSRQLVGLALAIAAVGLLAS